MNPQHFGTLQQKPTIPVILATIDTSSLMMIMTYEFRASTPYNTVNVTPDTMSTTLTRVDTGDGIFATLSTYSETGDYEFRATASSANDTGFARTMVVYISDDAAEAETVIVAVRQLPEPV